MTKKIFRSILLSAVVVLLVSNLLATGGLYRYFSALQSQQIDDQLELAAYAVEENGVSYLEQLRAENQRLTWVAADGTVRYDTRAVASKMENHSNREEIREALAAGRGSSVRRSDTLLENTIYRALRLEDGSVLRISVSRSSTLALVLGIAPFLTFALIVVAAVSWILAKRMAAAVVQPLNKVNLDQPLENDTYEELAPLLGRIHQQHRQIQEQMQQLEQKTNEFTQVTSGMKEGLVLLNQKGEVLSINPAACALFEVQESECVGEVFLSVDRSQNMTDALYEAMESGQSKSCGTYHGRTYQFDVSRVESGNEVTGAVVLAMDVSEQAAAERMRREFTANASHELKTPLTSIVGNAELLRSGLVKQEDVPQFLQNLYTEAQRMVTLIDDIIRLSQMEEGDNLASVNIRVLDEVQEVVTELRGAADLHGVKLHVSGENCSIFGAKRPLHEIIYNLIDNAIMYNRPGGSVEVTVSGNKESDCVLTVSDTGIGIPKEHQERIFERFYRVDKSHSKQSGGTGLGLSIVKHAAEYLGAQVELNSVPGQGTTVRVRFRKG